MARLIATLRKDYADRQRRSISPKARWCVPRWPGRNLLYAPGPRASIESVAVGRDAIYAAITENVIGSVHVFTKDGSGWSERKLALPPGGAADIASVNDFGPEAMFSFQSYLTPPTSICDRRQERRRTPSNPCRRGSTPAALSPSNSRRPRKTAPRFPISSRGRKISPARRPRCSTAMAASRFR